MSVSKPCLEWVKWNKWSAWTCRNSRLVVSLFLWKVINLGNERHLTLLADTWVPQPRKSQCYSGVGLFSHCPCDIVLPSFFKDSVALEIWWYGTTHGTPLSSGFWLGVPLAIKEGGKDFSFRVITEWVFL